MCYPTVYDNIENRTLIEHAAHGTHGYTTDAVQSDKADTAQLITLGKTLGSSNISKTHSLTI